MNKLEVDLYPNLEQLLEMKVIEQGYTSDLHFDTDDVRLWVHRTGLADGEPYENAVSVEVCLEGDNQESTWVSIGTYDGDNPPEHLKGFSFGDMFTLQNKPSVQNISVTLNNIPVSYQATVFIDGSVTLTTDLVADQLGFINWHE